MSTQELLRPGTSAGGVVGGVRPRSRSGGHWIDVRSRGWLIRRALLAADLVGLGVAFLVGELSTPRSIDGAYDVYFEIGLFLARLPVWVVSAKLARPVRPRRGVRRPLDGRRRASACSSCSRSGPRLAYAGVTVTDLGNPQLGQVLALLGLRGRARDGRAGNRARRLPPDARLPSEHADRRRRGRRPGRRAQDASSTPSSGSTSSASSTRGQGRACPTSEDLPILGSLERPARARARARGRARDHRLRGRPSRADARVDPRPQGPAGAGRRRPAFLRDDPVDGDSSTRSRACRWSASRRRACPARRSSSSGRWTSCSPWARSCSSRRSCY